MIKELKLGHFGTIEVLRCQKPVPDARLSVNERICIHSEFNADLSMFGIVEQGFHETDILFQL